MLISFKSHSLLIFIFLIINFTGASMNNELDLGDICVLKDNALGICQEMKDCDYAKKLYKERKISELTSYLCKFRGRIPFVCCPTTSDVRLDKESTTEKIEETSVISPPQSIKISRISKFQKALCENETAEITLQPNIIGGENADVGEFPYIAAIGYKIKTKTNSTNENKIHYLCGGSLIAEDIVMTAAHCVNRRDAVPKEVKLGRTSLVPSDYDHSDGDDIEIEYLKIHPNYSSLSKHSDIALMKLKRPYNISSGFINPICLSSSDENLPLNFTIAGFGRNDVNKHTTSDWLLKATVNEHPFNKCQEIFSNASSDASSGSIKIIDSQFCAVGYKGADSCQGDSGGPLSYEKSLKGGSLTYLHGVVSTGISCGSAFPGIYTKVNKYLDWIEEVMNSME